MLLAANVTQQQQRPLTLLMIAAREVAKYHASLERRMRCNSLLRCPMVALDTYLQQTKRAMLVVDVPLMNVLLNHLVPTVLLVEEMKLTSMARMDSQDVLVATLPAIQPRKHHQHVLLLQTPHQVVDV